MHSIVVEVLRPSL